MQVSMGDGGGSSAEILMNYEEIEEIIRRFQNIYSIYTDTVGTNASNLANCKFYLEGEAVRVISVYPHILNKILELADHYRIAASIIGNVREEMKRQDEELFNQLQPQE